MLILLGDGPAVIHALKDIPSILPKVCFLYCPGSFRTWSRSHLPLEQRPVAGRSHFLCTERGYTTDVSTHLKDHQRTHTGERSSGAPNATRASLAGSTRTCSRSNLLPQQMPEARRRRFLCIECGYTTNFSTHFKDHQRTHTGERPFRCTHCSKDFTVNSHLIRHLHIHTGERPCRCNLCPMGFARSAQLRRHMRTHSHKKPSISLPFYVRYAFFYCAGSTRNWSRSNLLPQQTPEAGRSRYLCIECGYTTDINSHFKGHQRTHTGERPFQCTHCNKSFAAKHNLKQHLRIHTGERPYRCKHCSKAFIQTSHLKEHVHIHTGERPYRCKHCNKAFIQISHLKQHVHIHTGERPYQCNLCPMAFATSINLRRHVQRTHKKQSV
ncbi:uncharacterized protein LOC144108309 [Amblyomma americanum]